MSLKEEHRKAIASKDKLGSLAARQDTPEYQQELAKVVKSFQICENYVNQLSLFSSNETKDDLVTGDIGYMDIRHHLANLYERVRGDSVDRLDALNKSVEYHLEFLQLLDAYEILTKTMSHRLKDVTSHGNSLKYLAAGDATQRRQDKIDQFKLERALQEKLKQTGSSLEDEDELRRIKIADLGLKAIKSFNALDTMAMEIDLVKNAPDVVEPPLDSRERQRDSKEYQPGVLDQASEASGPLLSKEGKVRRPFTIVSSRAQIKNQVQGTGQYLPTMTVDEYLDEEFKSGRVLQGGEQSAQTEEVDEDNMDRADEETYKAREWDEFVEANPKGSGNTMNRG